MRTYESHSKKANKKKIEMFNQGEIAVFKRTGLNPVFFGETLIRAKLQNVSYVLTYADMRRARKMGRPSRPIPNGKNELLSGIRDRRQQHQ